MNIQQIKVKRIQYPLKRTFITAIRKTDVIEDIFIEIITDQGIGYGSAPATTAITGDTLSGMEKQIKTFADEVTGQDVASIKQIDLPKALSSTGAAMAVDMAVYDLLAKADGLPLCCYLGGNTFEVNTDISLSCGSIEAVEMAVNEALASGFNSLKVKLGNDVKADIQLCRHLKTILPKHVGLRFDANQGWQVDECLSFIDALASLNLTVELIEQPLPAKDLAGMAKVTNNSPYPIVADESVFSLEDAEKVIQAQAANMINIKLAKSGGIARAYDIFKLAEENHIECMVGCMMESPLGIGAAAHFAAAAGITKTDLDPLDWVDQHYYQSWLKFDPPVIHLPNMPGIGFEPDR